MANTPATRNASASTTTNKKPAPVTSNKPAPKQVQPKVEETMQDEEEETTLEEEEEATDEASNEEEEAVELTEEELEARNLRYQATYDANKVILKGLDSWGTMVVDKTVRIKFKDEKEKKGYSENRVKFCTLSVPAPYPFAELSVGGELVAVTKDKQKADSEGNYPMPENDPRLYGYSDKRINALHGALIASLVLNAGQESKVHGNGTATNPKIWADDAAAREGITVSPATNLPSSWDTLSAKASKVTAGVVREAMAFAALAWVKSDPKEKALVGWHAVVNYQNGLYSAAMPTAGVVKSMLKRPEHADSNEKKIANATKFLVEDGNIQGYLDQLKILGTPGAMQALSAFEEALEAIKAETEVVDDEAY